MLFNLFISDIYDGLASKKVKFADDGTIWLTGDIPDDLSVEMAKDLAKIANWTYKWRMKLNADKTENCLLTRNPEHTAPTVVMKGKVLKCTEKVKVLGVILDKKLTFQQHIDMVEKKTAKALGQLQIVGRTVLLLCGRQQTAGN